MAHVYDNLGTLYFVWNKSEIMEELGVMQVSISVISCKESWWGIVVVSEHDEYCSLYVLWAHMTVLG